MEKEKLRKKLKECFKKCAFGRVQLRKCVVDAMNSGLTKDEVLAITRELPRGVGQYEASLCAVIAVGQILRFEKTSVKAKSISLKHNKKEEIKDKLRDSFRRCGLAKRQLRKCVGNAMDRGLTKDEVLAITDDIVGGLGKSQVSLCAIVAIDHALNYEESSRKVPLDIIKERRLERGDA